MFSELPSIFDRNFVIAFFLPGLFFIAASLGLLYGFGIMIPISDEVSLLQHLTLMAAGALLGGIILLVLNFEIYRLLEGYPLKWVQWLSYPERRRYKRLKEELSALDAEDELYDTSDEMPPQHAARRQALMLKAPGRFPDGEGNVLPTSFGNIIRAFEVYSRVIYGIEAIRGWSRLQAVMPKSYHEIINEAKTITDFWVNLIVLGGVFLLEYAALVIYVRRAEKLWLPALTLVLIAFFYSRAKVAAQGWGETVKAAFDVFLPDLRRKLGFPFPKSMKDEREQWQRLSWIMIYHLNNIELERVKPSDSPGDESGSEDG